MQCVSLEILWYFLDGTLIMWATSIVVSLLGLCLLALCHLISQSSIDGHFDIFVKTTHLKFYRWASQSNWPHIVYHQIKCQLFLVIYIKRIIRNHALKKIRRLQINTTIFEICFVLRFNKTCLRQKMQSKCF